MIQFLNMHNMNKIYLRVILVFFFSVPLEGITVKPTKCPTNKIAPHKRSPYYGHIQARTFGAYYDLLSPGSGGGSPYDHTTALQEQPQEDDPDDCGDIENYDETDLSSLTQPTYMRGHNDNRFFFFNRPRPQSTTTTRAPPTFSPTPPYWSGGYFSNNHYRPPLQQQPSAHVKPVHEGLHETHSTYRPDVVGGPVGGVVGHPVRPTRPSTKPPTTYTTQKRLHYHTRYPPRTTGPQTTRPVRPRMFSNDGILGSFVDLLFK